jgi:hypothetical protein
MSLSLQADKRCNGLHHMMLIMSTHLETRVVEVLNCCLKKSQHIDNKLDYMYNCRCILQDAILYL